MHVYLSVHMFVCTVWILQELVEMTDMENNSDVGGFSTLEGHGRAASMPRLSAGFQVSLSLFHSHSLLSLSAFICFRDCDFSQGGFISERFTDKGIRGKGEKMNREHRFYS